MSLLHYLFSSGCLHRSYLSFHVIPNLISYLSSFVPVSWPACCSTTFFFQIWSTPSLTPHEALLLCVYVRPLCLQWSSNHVLHYFSRTCNWIKGSDTVRCPPTTAPPPHTHTYFLSSQVTTVTFVEHFVFVAHLLACRQTERVMCCIQLIICVCAKMDNK